MPVSPRQHAASPLRHDHITTLLELVTALQEHGGADDDAPITTALAQLCQSGRLRFLRPRLAERWVEALEES